MKKYIAAIAVPLAVTAGAALAAHGITSDDKYRLKEANGISFSEIRGYETWPTVSVSQIEEGAGQEQGIKVIVANPTMVKAYQDGIPENGKAFPEGSKIVKIEWAQKRDPNAPYTANVPDKLKKIGLIIKDSKRFAETNGWGYAQFLYDPSSGKFTPEHTDAGFAKPQCHTCHLAVTAKDYIFTEYSLR